MADRVAPTRSDATLVRLLWASVLVLVLISVAMVTRRTLDLLGIAPAFSALSASAPLDAASARYTPLTMVHIGPGLIFIGGATERVATALFGVLFLFALARAFMCIRRRQVVLHSHTRSQIRVMDQRLTSG